MDAVGEGPGMTLREALVWLVRYRRGQGVMQKEVATAMHISQSVVSKLEVEDPKNRPLRLLEDYAAALGFELRVELVRKDVS